MLTLRLLVLQVETYNICWDSLLVPFIRADTLIPHCWKYWLPMDHSYSLHWNCSQLQETASPKVTPHLEEMACDQWLTGAGHKGLIWHYSGGLNEVQQQKHCGSTSPSAPSCFPLFSAAECAQGIRKNTSVWKGRQHSHYWPKREN